MLRVEKKHYEDGAKHQSRRARIMAMFRGPPKLHSVAEATEGAKAWLNPGQEDGPLRHAAASPSSAISPTIEPSRPRSLLNIVQGSKKVNHVLPLLEERLRICRKEVQGTFASVGRLEHEALAIAMVDQAPESRYAMVVFNNLALNVKEGPEDLLTRLTQEVLIDSHVNIEQTTMRHAAFANLLQLAAGPSLTVMNCLGLTENDLQGLESRLRNAENLLTIVNPFVTAPDTTAQDIPILDCAIALFGETSEKFIVYHRLRLKAVVECLPESHTNNTFGNTAERTAFLVAVWETRTFRLRVGFLEQVERDLRRLECTAEHAEGEVKERCDSIPCTSG